MNSPKVDPLDSNSWKDDAPMMPNLVNDSPSSSPRTPLLCGDVVRPLDGFTALKLGYPFKGSLKKPPQRAYVAPSFQDNESMNASIHDVEGPELIQPEKRSIKWLDNHGKELIDVKEFEPSGLFSGVFSASVRSLMMNRSTAFVPSSRNCFIYTIKHLIWSL